ncbi:MAG: YciI family protein [Actinomycetota bacterium]|nr:YciI family protein [Actinomycetota bacterium]
MQYLALIYADENGRDSASEENVQRMYAAYGAFTEEVQKRGVMRGGAELEPVSTATTVRVRNGETMVTDGPFAETKETLGGFYLLECDSLDDAVELAAKIPGAQYGSVEVRPVVER